MPDDSVTSVLRTIRFDASAQKEAGKRMSSVVHYQRGPFRTGFWAAEPGTANIAYTKDELCTLLEGEVKLTDAAGHSETYVAGDSFVIPKGFTGVWETVKPVRKFFAVYED